MKWTVTISDPLNDGVLATVENGRDTSGVVVMRGFDPPIVQPPGSGKNLNLYVRQDALEVPPRAIIQFSLEDEPVFWGPAVIVPALTSPGAGPRDPDRDSLERVTAAGGEQLLRDSVCGPRLFDRESMSDLGSNDVATVAHELCRLYAHPALTVAEENFPATGGTLDIFYKPEATLYDALKELAGTVTGAAFWVDAAGAVRFEVES